MEPFIGEIRLFPYPNSNSALERNWWLPCDGRSLQVNNYTVLNALIGNRYGGDGIRTFNLPDLRSRAVVGCGLNTITGKVYQLAEAGGSETVALTAAQMPPHTHTVMASTQEGAKAAYPEKLLFGKVAVPTTAHQPIPIYANLDSTATALNTETVGFTGGAQGHPNHQPFLGLGYFIAVSGLFPTRP